MNSLRASPKKNADGDVPPIVPFTWLVIISPDCPETVLEVYGCTEVRRSVYEAVAGLQMRVVVLAELSRTHDTLLPRMLGAGPLLSEALAALCAAGRRLGAAHRDAASATLRAR